MVVERAVQQWHRPRRKGAGVRGRGGGGGSVSSQREALKRTPIRLASSGNVSISTTSQHPIVLSSKSYSLRVASSQRRKSGVRSGSIA
jgi:hypothetical protein